jgi:hypothetical protein
MKINQPVGTGATHPTNERKWLCSNLFDIGRTILPFGAQRAREWQVTNGSVHILQQCDCFVEKRLIDRKSQLNGAFKYVSSILNIYYY